jgi:23S rRNA (guanosine2251-2'-O)-methyltransferase
LAPSDLLGEDEELVAGRRPVEEAFVARRPARRLLVVPQRRQALERLVLHATSLRIPVVEVEGGTLTAVAGFDGHQGIALVVEPRSYAGLDDVLARAVERGEPPFILVLDSLEDPQNVGTLLRSAEAAGVHGVLFPTHHQAPLSPAAIKASAGAVEHLLLCPVDDLPGALSDLRIRGLRVAAAEADAPLTAAQADLRGPLAIVVGSEGQGLSPVVRRRADVSVRIPMRGAIGSLNAAVAGSILLFAAVGQRDPAGDGSSDRARPKTFDEISADPASGASAPPSDGAVEGMASDLGPSTETQPLAARPKRPRKGPAKTPELPIPAAPPVAAAKRLRPPAPTTAAQKRSRAAAVTSEGATPPADGGSLEASNSAAKAPPAPDARRKARSTTAAPSIARSAGPIDDPAPPAAARRRTPAATKPAVPKPAATKPAAPKPAAPKPAATKRAAAKPAAAKPAAAPADEHDATGDDLLPGEPAGD